MPITPAIPLYDRVQQFTAQPMGRFLIPGAMQSKETIERQQINYRRLIRNARRFQLDDDFTRTVLEISQDINAMENRVNLARLPYPVMWMEWDTHVKVEHSHRMKTLRNTGAPMSAVLGPEYDLIPRQSGMLLQEVDPVSGAWVGTFFNSSEVFEPGSTLEATAQPDPICWFVKPEGNSSLNATAPAGWEEASSFLPSLPPGIDATAFGIASSDSRFSVVFMPWIGRRVKSLMEPMWKGGHTAQLRALHKHHDPKAASNRHAKFTDSMLSVFHENTGLTRFVIAILALINKVPDVKIVGHAGGGHHIKRAKRMQYLGHSTIKLELPKNKTITMVARQLEVESDLRRKNRAHEVRGHFRRIEYGKAPGMRCDHEPTMVENGVGICLNCEQLIKWIPARVRGDKSLGWVEHDYTCISSLDHK